MHHRHASTWTQFYILTTAFGWWGTLNQYLTGEPAGVLALELAMTLYLTHMLHTSVRADKDGSSA